MTVQRLEAVLDVAREHGRPICLDTSAMLAFLLDEPAAPHVAALFMDRRLSVLVSTITLAEVAVRPARDRRDGAATMIRRVVGLPGLRVEPLDEVIALVTAHVRASTRLRLPDAVVIATARAFDAVALVGNDRQWLTRDLGMPFITLDDLVTDIGAAP